MIKWESTSVTYERREKSFFESFFGSLEDIEKKDNEHWQKFMIQVRELESQGWECFAITPETMHSHHARYFKRIAKDSK